MKFEKKINLINSLPADSAHLRWWLKKIDILPKLLDMFHSQ